MIIEEGRSFLSRRPFSFSRGFSVRREEDRRVILSIFMEGERLSSFKNGEGTGKNMLPEESSPFFGPRKELY